MMVKLPLGCQYWMKDQGRDDENYLDLLSPNARGMSRGGVQKAGAIRSDGIHERAGRLLGY